MFKNYLLGIHLAEVEKYLEVQRLKSATKIQAFFRGYNQRRMLASGGQDRLIADRAARRIQQYISSLSSKKTSGT